MNLGGIKITVIKHINTGNTSLYMILHTIEQ